MILFIAAFIATGAVMSVHGMFQYAGYDFAVFDSVADKFRVFSTAGSPASLAGWLAACFLLTIGFASVSKSKPSVLLCIPASFMAVCVFLTGSRSGMIALASGLIFTTVLLAAGLRGALPGLVRTIAFTAALSCILIIAGKIVLAPSANSARGRNIVAAYSTEFKSGSVKQRTFTLMCAADMFETHPAIGSGPGSFTVLYPLAQMKMLRDPDIARKYSRVVTNRIATHAHNEYAEISVEAGALGLLCFLAVIIFAVRHIARLAGNNHDNDANMALRIFAGGAFAAMCVQAAFEFSLHDPMTALAFWGVLGIACAPASRGNKIAVNGIHLVVAVAAVAAAFYAPRPVFAMLRMMDASAAASRGRMEQALQLMSDARSLDSASPEVLIGSAAASRMHGDMDNAISYINDAKKFSNSPELYAVAGRTYAVAGRAAEAENAFLTAIAIDPWKPVSWFNLSQLYQHTGKYKEAKEAYDRALMLSDMPPYNLDKENSQKK